MPTTILDGETYEQARHRRFTEEAKVIEKMQQDEIIRMAREVWGERAVLPFNDLERFAALVAAHEREACAKAVEAGVLGHGECAEAIRNRSNASR